MDFYISGFEADLTLEIENVKRFMDEYRSVNSVLDLNENLYDSILLDFGTERLKLATSLLTTLLTDIERRGVKAVSAVFDILQREKEFDLAVFLSNRIFEKYRNNSLEEILIRTKIYTKVLNILLNKKDVYFFTYYLSGYLDDLNLLLKYHRDLIEEIFISATYFNQFMYSYYVTVINDNERALGYLIKDIELRDHLFRKGILRFPENNNIFHIINLTGLFFQLEDSLIKLMIDLDFYIRKIRDELLELNKFLKKNPDKRSLFLNYDMKRYINEFLTNIYIAGYENYYMEISDIFPELTTGDNRIIIKMLDLYKKDDLSEEKIKSLKKEMEILFNNISKDKKERVLYTYYNILADLYSDNVKELMSLKREIEKEISKLPILKIPLFRILNFSGYTEEAYNIAQEVKRELIISGRENLLKTVERFIEEEF
ncbi:MAG TPA: hypothetical protein DEP48_04480 [Persephonella sp.]|uniref:Uncharacterized protein n=1 Tax=Persephonella marina (strain DSM 14350 / EX-H1) TaxID=123214 RepID=C0QQ46_PERMH|nr:MULTISPECIES: hypothetical protein [Persephonella]ACO04335.1 hypothetical protein PERMA_1007 [Persephonella marina EX-H1]HCB69593.1 hypothetical protein [Persephonella sp.]